MPASAAKPFAALGVRPQPPPPHDLAPQKAAYSGFLRPKLLELECSPLEDMPALRILLGTFGDPWSAARGRKDEETA